MSAHIGMRIQRTSQIITLCVAVLSVVTVACGVISLRYRTLQEKNYAARRTATKMMAQLAGGSDRLTNSVRAYAATGDRRYYDDFMRELNVDRTRDDAVEQLSRIELTPHERTLLTRAKSNSDQLVGLERRAFSAVENKDSATAISLVYGDEYRSAKSSIMQPIAECQQSLDTRLTAQAADLSNRARLAGHIGVGAILANALAIIAALLLFYRRRVVNPIAGLNGNLRDLLAHKPGVSIGHQEDESEIGEIARSLESYRRAGDQVETQRWIKSHVAEAGGLLQRAETPTEVARTVLSKVVPLVEGGCGAFYLFDDSSNRFEFVCGYGYQQRSAVKRSYALGEGIVGQCAESKEPITLRDLPANYMTIASGVGEAPPRVLVATPILSLGRALAVLEVASFAALTPTQTALLGEMATMTALNLEILQRNLKTRELLEQTQRQTDQLRASEEQFRTLLEAAPDSLIITDEDGRIVVVNRQTENLFGYSRDELVGRQIEMLVPQRVRPAHPELRRRFHAAPSVRSMGSGLDLSAVRKDGSEFPVEISLSPLRSPQGATLACSSVRDVTQRKRIEADLRDAMQKAEEATKAKSAFLANMSHEIRTPMNGILGMTELALDTDLTAEQRDYLNTVKGSADALLALINDILDFSKIEAGRIELDPIEFLLRDAISDTLNPLALRASSKGLELAYDIAADVPDALRADVYRLRQVIVNLVGNAIKFTDKGEVVVSVRVAESRGDERVLEFAVRDTGIGIPAAAAAKLFKPFEQADAATTRKFGGTGLGLAISRQLVELMGGQIRLESEMGRGSTFIFTTLVKIGTARSTTTVDEAARLFHGKTVLIVDDNETNRKILQSMLGHWGLRTLAVDSAANALAALDRSASAGQAISLVISDLHMPEMDGFDFIAALRRHSAFELLPVLLLTSSASPGDQKRCDELRVAARLLKPVKQSLLLDHILRILAGESHDRAPAPAAADEPAPAGPEGAPPESLNVLLAEDNPVNVKFALKVLERAGHRVVVAGNGREAVNQWQSRPFDLILMDVQMPEMDGLDATRAIRSAEAARGGGGGHVPIVAMTANAMAGDREMCIDAGMDGYVTKPVKRETLFAEVGRVMAIAGGKHATV